MNIKDTGPYLESKESLKINESIEIIRNKRSNILLMNNNKSIKNEDNANYKHSKTKEDRLKRDETNFLNDYDPLNKLNEKIEAQNISDLLKFLP